jgi:steroid delta-isomerase-like uncharacterized protein
MATQMSPYVKRLVDAYNSRTLEDFDSLLSDDVVLVRAGEKAHGRDEFKGVLQRLRRAFPDIQYRIDDVIESGDRLALRWEAKGTHRGEYLGVPATGRDASYSGVTIYELRDGKIARVWVAADLLSLLRSLSEGRGASPPEASV